MVDTQVDTWVFPDVGDSGRGGVLSSRPASDNGSRPRSSWRWTLDATIPRSSPVFHLVVQDKVDEGGKRKSSGRSGTSKCACVLYVVCV